MELTSSPVIASSPEVLSFRKVRITLTIGIVLFIGFVLIELLSSPDALKLLAEGSQYPLYVIRSELRVVQMEMLWSLKGLHAAPVLLVIAGLTLSILSIGIPGRIGFAGRVRLTQHSQRFPQHPLFLFLAGSGISVLFMVDPAKNITFADAFRLADSLRDLTFARSEVGTSALFWIAHGILQLFGLSNSMETAIRVVSCLSGGLYAVGVSIWAKESGRILQLNAQAKNMLFLGGLLTGAVVLFFGYVETTQVVAALLAVLFGALARFFAAADKRERKRYFRWVAVISGLAVCSHTGAIAILPMLFVLMIFARHQGVKGTGTIAGLWTLLPIVLALGPFYLRGDFGTVAGGGDGIMFVPFVHAAPAWPRTDHMVYYSMFSLNHLIDIGNAIILSSPLALFSIATSAFLRWNTLPQQYTRYLICGVTAAAGCGSIVALWNCDFGMWGDWNICAAYLLPFHLLAWALLAVWLRSQRGRWLMIGAISCQVIAILGLAYQIW